MIYQTLYNPLAGNGRCENTILRMKDQYPADTFLLHDMTGIPDLGGFLSSLPEKDHLLICGGDGTLHRFVNHPGSSVWKRNIYFFPSGTGDDFYRDITSGAAPAILEISGYLHDLPRVTLNGNTFFFLDNVSFGIDGDVCEAGDRIRQKSDRPINYMLLALQGLIGGYKPRGATVTVDGVSMRYEHVWLAPSMNGRYIGNGMPAAPSQDRLNPEHLVTSLVFDCSSRLKTLICFPRLLNATHTTLRDMHIRQGKHVEVVFDSPATVQVDGEVFLNIRSYSVSAAPDYDSAENKEGEE